MGDSAALLPSRAPDNCLHTPTATPKFVLTGFGEFCGVAHNPTQALVTWLQTRQQSQHGAPRAAAPHAALPGTAANAQQQHASSAPGQAAADYSLQSLHVLEVSARAVDAFMRQQQAALLQQAVDSSAGGRGLQPVVMLHLGVDTQRPAISLELQAYNAATFSCPDQAGWQPKAHMLEPRPGLGISSVRTTTLPLKELVQQLQEAGFACDVSRDAGRFVCNYTYYRSLQMTSSLQQALALHHVKQQASGGSGAAAAAAAAAGHASWPCFSLFVHVPSFDVVSEQRQQAFLTLLLDLIAKLVSGCAEQGQQGQQQAAVHEHHEPPVAVS